MFYLVSYIFGFSLGILAERNRIFKNYNDEINKYNSEMSELVISNKKYKSYIFHKNLLEDWKNYDKECFNNDELPLEQID